MKASALRASVLQQAVQGKLVPQIECEGTAKELLREIERERAELIKMGKIKMGKLLPAIEDDEKPFEIPRSWEWVRLGNIIELISGRDLEPDKYSDKKIGIPYLTGASNILSGVINIERWTEKPQVISLKGDLLISCKGTVGKTVIQNIDKLHIARQIMALRPIKKLDVNYLKIFIDSYVDVLIGTARSMIPGISRDHILPIVFPLPPLAEQKRIVQKLDELMPLIDEYEKEEVKLSKLDKELPDKLRKSVLEQAVQGKLVPQIESEGTAGELLKEIKKEIEVLVKEGKIKKGKPLAKIEEDEKPFEIPKSWEWVRLGDIIELISGRDLKPDNYSDKKIGIPYLTGASNILSGVINIERWTEKPQVISLKGDLLISCKGTVGKTVIQDIDKLHIARQIMALRPIKKLDVNYLKIFIDSYVDVLIGTARSMIPGISRDHILPIVFPLPPLAEQKRIVQKLDEMMKIIGGLK